MSRIRSERHRLEKSCHHCLSMQRPRKEAASDSCGDDQTRPGRDTAWTQHATTAWKNAGTSTHMEPSDLGKHMLGTRAPTSEQQTSTTPQQSDLETTSHGRHEDVRTDLKATTQVCVTKPTSPIRDQNIGNTKTTKYC